MSTELEDLIRALTDMFGDNVVVHQTHISVVFVTAERAYKMKKPVDLGFVDYSTSAKRRHFCEEEVRLNKRLAPGIYLGVKSIVKRDGEYEISEPDDTDAIDWVVEMVRLNDDDTLLSYFHDSRLTEEVMVELGERMAAFHSACARGEVGSHGSFETVAKNARDNFSQSLDQVGKTVHRTVFDAAKTATDALLSTLETTIENRDKSGITCDTHGDLRLEHVYLTEAGLCVVDCIEFNDAFRYADPVADIAFLVMDLRIRWGERCATYFTDSYFKARPGGEALLDFYVAYRSAVRAKVHGMAAIETELDEKTRERAQVKSSAHWLFAWSTLAPPFDRPALVLIGGLPGIGKSTLARALEQDAGFTSVDSDHVRKELAGVEPTDSMRAGADAGIYTPEWTERTYDELLRRAMDVIAGGGRVAISATFRSNSRREKFLRAAHAAGVCGLMIECVLPKTEALRRIEARRGDASDADVSTYEHIAATWDEPSQFVASRLARVSTESIEIANADLHQALQTFGLA